VLDVTMTTELRDPTHPKSTRTRHGEARDGVPHASPTPVAEPHRLRRRIGHFAALVATVLASAGLTYTLGARGAAEQWNATDQESTMTLPGDDIIVDASTPMTRAVTIDATPQQVWPWVAQFGQGRGGLYSYDWLENLVGCDIHSLDHIDPSLQHPVVGDRIFVTPDGYPADLGMVVDQVQPNEALVLRLSTAKQPFARADSPWTWTFVLRPTGDGRTRLISRERYRSGGAVADTLSRQTIGAIDFVMSRRMLTGMGERAEQTAGHGAGSTWSETLWFVGLIVAAAGLVASLASRRPLRQRLAFAAVGGVALTLVVFRFWTPWASWILAASAIALAVMAWREPRAAVDHPASTPSTPTQPRTDPTVEADDARLHGQTIGR
jgi:hypothetical protein